MLPAALVVLTLVGLMPLCVSTALAESDSSPTAWKDQCPLDSQSYADGEDFARSTSYQEVEEPPSAPPLEEPELAPLPDEAYDSPSDLPPGPASEPPEPSPRSVPSESEIGFALACDECQASGSGCCSRCGRCRRVPCRSSCGLGGRGLGIRLGGWIEQGITVNGDYPADRFNGPLTFNDRDAEYQLNQLWAYAERPVNTRGHGWDVGGRVDFIYGTDRRFTQAYGLEDDWNSHRFYGAALPQAYLDVGVNDLTVRMGHYFTIIGYEVVAAPDNFFYSHSYAHQYGEPFTHTGLLATHALGSGLKVSAGFDRGWDMWEDNNTDLSFLGGIEGTSRDGRTSLAFAITSGKYDDAGENRRNMYSVVFKRRVTCRLRYVLQHDFGIDYRGSVRMPNTRSRADAQWYGINQYLLYQVNPCWDLGLRLEWFRDDDGTRVGGIGAPNGWSLGPDIANNQIGWAGNFYAITCGINWKPTENIAVRPECRWDWYNGPVDHAGRLPYNFGSEGGQFTFGTDLIYTF
ncbi:MAG: hypothetical protein A2V70_05870 [Planctomycetes bacterium RBG_13_63_9]|nr:MAG: hypothetical protein A2V70_05870 [Planctomycetes bacterium RBG_13_63_9]